MHQVTMHGAYRRNFGPESVVELGKNIIIQHEDFLKQDDPDKRADALRYMAGYAVQYLHLVPQEKKFTFKQTERVLHNSAMNIAEFDPREGYLAFCNLAKYAENLLEQPWRSDFHVIKLTSGFYVHNIAAQLQNAHEILIVMGYVNIDDTTLKLLPNLNYNNLKAISRDCYIASQECLILSQIWQHVADQEPDYPLTTGEVFEYRKNHLGDTDTICNKLLYDIRARMHLVKQQQQFLQRQQQQSSGLLKNTQRFVPVDRLIDYDADDVNTDDTGDNVDSRNFVPEREVERSQEMLKNVNIYAYQDDEHIYDPVYGGDIPQVPSHHYPRRNSNQKTQIEKVLRDPYAYNNNSRKSAPAPTQSSNYNAYQQPQQQFQNNYNSSSSTNQMYDDERNSMSPMIPKTVTSLFSSNNYGSSSRSNVSKSNSMNSISAARSGGGSSSGSSASHPQYYPVNSTPLTKSKVRETDLDAVESHNAANSRDNAYHHNSNVNSDGRILRTRKSVPTSMLQNSHNNQVYPDEFYPPGIVKPVAVYGSSQPNSNGVAPGIQYYMPGQPRQGHQDNTEDVLNEAYAYASEVSQIPRGHLGNSRNGGQGQPMATKGVQVYQHQATPIPKDQRSDSDSVSASSENHSRGSSVRRDISAQLASNAAARSSSSAEASSSWDGSLVDGSNHHQHHQPYRKSEGPKRPSHIDIRGSGGVDQQSKFRYADSSPESDLQQINQEIQQHQQQPLRNKNTYRELSSSSSGSGESPTSGSSLPHNYPRKEELNSLDTVYYDYLLKQGQTDEILGNHKNGVNRTDHVPDSRPVRTSGASNRRSNSSTEPEENHIYDGRRVTTKRKNQGQENISIKRTENDGVRRRQIPTESTMPYGNSPPDSNYNNYVGTSEVGKPSYEKNMRKSNLPASSSEERKIPIESELPPITPPKVVEPWDCRFCTFRNLNEERICEMCAKSKDFYEEVDAPLPGTSAVQQREPENIVLPKIYSVPNHNINYANAAAVSAAEESEERPCPQCTLLNSVRARVCDACNFRLKPLQSPSAELVEEEFDNR